MAADSRSLLVFFTSASSGPCRRMESLVAHIARKERDRLRVIQIDVDRGADLVQQLAVESVPTLVLIKDRKAVGRLDGRSSAPQIEAMIEEHLVEQHLLDQRVAEEPLVSSAAG